MAPSVGVMQRQLLYSHAAPPLSFRRAIAPAPLLQLRHRCSPRTNLHIVRAGDKKKLKEQLEALAEVQWKQLPCGIFSANMHL
jgi:hypothetical protein